MNKLIILDHSQQRSNRCAQGDSEFDHTKIITEKVYKILRKENIFSVKYIGDSPSNLTDRESLKWSISQENKIGSRDSYYIGIHTNAAGGTGTEAIYYPGNEKSKYLAICLCKEMFKLGLNYRRVFHGKNFYALNSTKSNAVIMECWFHDNKAESKWGHDHFDEVAEAIINGIYRCFDMKRPEKKPSILIEVKKIEESIKRIKEVLI